MSAKDADQGGAPTLPAGRVTSSAARPHFLKIHKKLLDRDNGAR